MANNLTPVIHIDQGLIRGRIAEYSDQNIPVQVHQNGNGTTQNGNCENGDNGFDNVHVETKQTYCAFEGIPYAEPPLRELRFKDPKPSKCWSGILKATVLREPCISSDFFHPEKIIGDEDCLYLNVYTPAFPEKVEKSLKGVVVLISDVITDKHIYNPQSFIQKNVVFVNISFRTGVLGFLSLNDKSKKVFGNFGLKDIALALKWIKSNISKFYGDPNNITLLGLGAGACYAHLLSIVPTTESLVHRLILLSGSAIVPWTKYATKSNLLAEKLECQEEEIFKSLITMSAKNLIGMFAGKEYYYFSPVIEPVSCNAILTKDPISLLRDGNFRHIPIMLSACSNEALLVDKFHTDIKPDTLNYELYVTEDFNLKRGTRICKEVGKEIKQFYYGDDLPTKDNLEPYHQMITDIYVFRGIEETAKLIKKKIKKPLYLLRFAIDGQWNLYKNFTASKLPGACCVDMLGYLFEYEGRAKLGQDSIERKISEQLLTFFANFITKGEPNNFEEENNIINVKWKPITKKDYNYIDMSSDKLLAKTDPGKTTCDFWNDIKLFVQRR